MYRGEDCMDKSIEQLGNIKESNMISLNTLMLINQWLLVKEKNNENSELLQGALFVIKHDECDAKARDAKTQNRETKITNSSEVLSWGGCPKTKNKKHNPRRLFGE